MDKLKATIDKIGALDLIATEKAQERLDCLTKPQGSLGRLEDLGKQLAGITGKAMPSIKNKVIFTLAADHGVAQEGVSAFPAEVTLQMVYNFLNEGAAINVLAKHVGARVVIVDMGVNGKFTNSPKLKDKKINFGTRNMTKGPAMTIQEAIKSLEAGIEIFEEEYVKGIDICGTGEMGIANTTSASAICAAILKVPVGNVTGRGTGIDDKAFAHKVEVIQRAIMLNKPLPDDPLGVLSKIGGYEIGGLAGIILASASKRVPVVIDGFISASAALLAYKLAPKTKEYMIAGHSSVEKGHKAILDQMGLKPVLDLDLRLGEGTGAVLAMGIIEASAKIMAEMATFKGANVAEKE